jgi:hypothetical protein
MGKRIDVEFATGEKDAKVLSAEPSKRTVAEWTKMAGVRRAIVAGAAHLAGWTPETELTRAAFDAGVAKFTETPMGG